MIPSLALLLVSPVALSQQEPPPPPPWKPETVRVAKDLALALVVSKEPIPCGRWAGPPATVLHEFLISTTGKVIGLKLIEGNQRLATIVAPALKQWRFKPVLSGTGALQVQARIDVSCPGKRRQ